MRSASTTLARSWGCPRPHGYSWIPRSLRRALPRAPCVFPAAIDPTRLLNASWVWRHVWSPLLDKAAVRAIRIHDARHTYASLMLRRGVPIAYVSRQLGHSSIQITVVLYGHFVPGGDRHRAEGLAPPSKPSRWPPSRGSCRLSRIRFWHPGKRLVAGMER